VFDEGNRRMKMMNCEILEATCEERIRRKIMSFELIRRFACKNEKHSGCS
jgi:hypothetical protein